MTTLGLIAVLGAILAGGPPEAPRDPGEIRALAIDVPIPSGSTAFEVPDHLAEGEVVLIVSAMGADGPYAVRCALDNVSESGRAPDLREVGPVAVITNAEESIGLAAPKVVRPVGAKPARGPIPPARDAAPARPALQRTFSVLARPGDPGSPSNYDLVEARLRALGERIQVFVDEDDVPGVGDDVLRAIVSAFDREIEPRLSARIGSVPDVDRDGRFTVLLSRRVGLPFPGRSHVDGYFRSADLDLDLPRPLSNRADMIYLDAGLRAGPYLETILAHEYAHAILDALRRQRRGPLGEESWLDEAMAHLCEDLAGRSAMNLDYRVAAFLAEPNRYRVIVDDEHRPGRFRSHGNRGASYLFLRWCAATFDPDLPRTLAASGSAGLPNLERATGLPFEELYRRWSIAVALSSLGVSPRGVGGLDLLDAIGDWPLGGVRFAEIGPDRPEQTFSLEGSSSQYLRIDRSAAGPTRVAIQCPPEAAVHLTALIVPTRLPRVSLDVSILDSGPEETTVVARVTERAGLTARLDRLSWEPLPPPPDQPRTSLSVGLLRGSELHSIFPEHTLGPGDRLTSAPFTIPNALIRSAPLIVRLSARTPDGVPAVCWADLTASPPVTPRPTRPASFDRPVSPPERRPSDRPLDVVAPRR